MKPKKSKKTFIFAIICLASIIFAACGDGAGKNASGEAVGENPATESELPSESSYYDELGGRDFGGETFKILSPQGILAYVPEEEFTGEPINDALIIRNSLIEEKYNVKIEYVHLDSAVALKGSVAAGEYLCDMIIGNIVGAPNGASFANFAQNGLLYDLAALPHLSLDSPWWSRLIYENLTFDGKLFYTAGDISPAMYQAPAAIYVNKKLLENYGVTENLYELVFSGKWTFDVVERIIKDMDQDLNQNGKMHINDDFFGFVQQNNTLTTNALCAAMGIKLATVKDNAITVDLISPVSIEKIEKLTDFFKKLTYDVQNDIITKAFHDGRAIFLKHFLESALLYLRDMEDDYGILPLPKYDEAQESYINSLNPWNPSSVGVPLMVEPEKVGLLMEAMGYASYEIVRPNIYEIVLKTKFARDAESARAIDLIIETTYLDFNGIYNFGRSTDIVSQAIIDKKALVSSYEKIENAILKDIDTFIDSISLIQ